MTASLPASGDRAAHRIRDALEQYVVTGVRRDDMVRGVVLDSWQRCKRNGIDEARGGILPAGKVLTIDLQYQNATAWNSKGLEGGGSETGIHTFSATASAFTSAVPWGAYFLKLPAPSDGYGAIFFWRTLSASPPFVPAPSVQLPTPAPKATRKP